MDLKLELNQIKQRLGKIEEAIRHIKGFPIIQGYASKRLDLNESLNVLDIKKGIADLESRVETLESP